MMVLTSGRHISTLRRVFPSFLPLSTSIARLLVLEMLFFSSEIRRQKTHLYFEGFADFGLSDLGLVCGKATSSLVLYRMER